MFNQAGYQNYVKSKYTTASPHRLVQMLFEAALTNIGRASQALDKKQISDSNMFIQKTHKIVSELLFSLNEEKGGELAANLKNIYLYILDRLVQANVKKDKTILMECDGLLREIKSAWDQIGKEVSIGQG
ncbi:flagellar export chaperone FliS [Cohnella fermenti]|uniref:Flagellar secretion chaperone FliS n=1 Tax=Cohnella fermenti TaxID=2565925 RepID=A0A4S4C024_9BACL|nr:flagellar export chaperone FliS [Cohnella fermenti]THF80803.1 flagellar export chaperone FliS [Cohnella fermenti]